MREVYKELETIYTTKNADYGDSFGASIREWGLIAAVVRMDDKMRRLKSLMTKEAKVHETIRDTLLDLANYAIMTVEAIDRKDDEKMEALR
jgi:hypothetical protein